MAVDFDVTPLDAASAPKPHASVESNVIVDDTGRSFRLVEHPPRLQSVCCACGRAAKPRSCNQR
eukprot:9761021-Alexandrium_andersonii.AAC.1